MPRFRYCAALLLTAASLLAQDKKPAQEQVAPDDFVVLISGACRTKPEEFAVRDCIRGVTREEFEHVLSIAAPDATPQIKQKLAESLGEIIILSNEAKKRELAKDPAVQQELRFTQLQTLATILVSQSLKKDAQNIPDAEIQQYYEDHHAEFQTAEFLRVLIPKSPTESDDDQAKFAESLRARCASGEDPANLQADADQHVNRSPIKLQDLKNQRRNMFEQAAQTIFQLSPGECSAVIPDKPEMAIYKMVASATAPLVEVRPSIVKVLENQRLNEALQKIKSQNVISLNGKYFDTDEKPAETPAKK